MATYRAVFYIADGFPYIKEACVSAKSVKSKVPDVDTFLFTPSNNSIKEAGNTFDNIITVHERTSHRWFLDHTRYMYSALNTLHDLCYGEVVYMDTDTYCCGDFSDVFDLLKKYDFAGVHAPGRYTTKTVNDVPRSFPEINVGFNPMRNYEKLRNMWKFALSLYQKNAEIYTNNDQGPLRDALWVYAEEVLLYVLPPEYNLKFNFPCSASRDVRVLHGHCDNHEAVNTSINSTGAMRAWYKNQLLE